MSDERIRIGMIGAGGICRNRHLPALRKIEGVEVVAVCNRSRESGQEVADAWGIEEVMTDWRALVEREDLDAIFIGTWPYMHKAMSVAALDAGKHVFCQARMAMDLPEALEMLNAARRHPNRVNMVCPPPHRMPWEPMIRHMIEEGQLGEIRDVRVACLNASAADPMSLTWRERTEYSGLQAMQVGIWAEVLKAWLGDYQELSATVATPIPEKADEAGKPYRVHIPQVVQVHGRLTNGATISEHHSSVALHDMMNFVSIYGSQGTLRVDVSQSIRFGRPGEPYHDLQIPSGRQRPWRVELDFIEAVRAAKQGEAWHVSPDFAEGVRYMRKLQAIYESARTGRTVNLEATFPLNGQTQPGGSA